MLTAIRLGTKEIEFKENRYSEKKGKMCKHKKNRIELYFLLWKIILVRHTIVLFQCYTCNMEEINYIFHIVVLLENNPCSVYVFLYDSCKINLRIP